MKEIKENNYDKLKQYVISPNLTLIVSIIKLDNKINPTFRTEGSVLFFEKWKNLKLK